MCAQASLKENLSTWSAMACRRRSCKLAFAADEPVNFKGQKVLWFLKRAVHRARAEGEPARVAPGRLGVPPAALIWTRQRSCTGTPGRSPPSPSETSAPPCVSTCGGGEALCSGLCWVLMLRLLYCAGQSRMPLTSRVCLVYRGWCCAWCCAHQFRQQHSAFPEQQGRTVYWA